MTEAIVFAVPTLLCAGIFIGIGIFALIKKTPMHFWAGTTVKSEEISDVKAYNRENGIMWIIYGSIYLLSAILALFFGSMVGGIIVFLSGTVGVIALLFNYQRIYKKYKG